MKNYQRGFTLVGLMGVMLAILGLIGHALNLFQLYTAITIENWAAVVVRCISLIVWPIGWIVGFIPF